LINRPEFEGVDYGFDGHFSENGDRRRALTGNRDPEDNNVTDVGGIKWRGIAIPADELYDGLEVSSRDPDEVPGHSEITVASTLGEPGDYDLPICLYRRR